MLAERFITRTDREGRLAGLPALPPDEEVEVIVLRKESQQPKPRNQPSPLLAGRGAKLLGDDVAPAFTAEEWGGLFQEDRPESP